MSVIDEIKAFDFENGDMGAYLSMCLKCETEEEAALFLKGYREIEPEFADKNLGYIFGYCSNEDRKKLYKNFPMVHPVFGKGFGREEDIGGRK
jgi:hypothetical protein